ncbi:MAG: hypothetical protein OXH09_17975 [Gammaproteobacteria bacterium]|nr:hypothetical protein [Gammaproteobacteria bacterium]
MTRSLAYLGRYRGLHFQPAPRVSDHNYRVVDIIIIVVIAEGRERRGDGDQSEQSANQVQMSRCHFRLPNKRVS